jgi:fumarylacetoacetase
VPLRERPSGDPVPLPHLADDLDRAGGAVDVMLETRLATTRMLRENTGSTVLGKASARELYWTVGQMVAHLTSNGCNVEAGDLLGSGTVSGDAADALGSLLEITRAGKEPLPLPGGEQRTFLEDGDEIVITGRCARKGFAPVVFVRCTGRITASLPE